MGRDMLELEQKQQLSREDAAARLRAIADELASGSDVVFESDGMRVVGQVPGDVRHKLEFEIGADETEFEIELTWATGGGSTAGHEQP